MYIVYSFTFDVKMLICNKLKLKVLFTFKIFVFYVVKYLRN